MKALEAVTYTTRQVSELDTLARRALISKHAVCEDCGRPPWKCFPPRLDRAHIVRCRFHVLRWELENLLALCHDCHDRADASPSNMKDLVDRLRGPGVYESLFARRDDSATRPFEEIRDELRAAW